LGSRFSDERALGAAPLLSHRPGQRQLERPRLSLVIGGTEQAFRLLAGMFGTATCTGPTAEL